jgi:hypothetical protein
VARRAQDNEEGAEEARHDEEEEAEEARHDDEEEEPQVIMQFFISPLPRAMGFFMYRATSSPEGALLSEGEGKFEVPPPRHPTAGAD